MTLIFMIYGTDIGDIYATFGTYAGVHILQIFGDLFPKFMRKSRQIYGDLFPKFMRKSRHFRISLH